MSRIILPPMLVGEQKNLTFDFTQWLAAGETLTSRSTVASVYSGTDASPSSLILGSSISGGIVTQMISTASAAAGNIYELKCTATTSASQTLDLSTFLAVVPDLP